MPAVRADVLALVPAVLELELVITKGGGWTIGLHVTDSAGANVDLTGTTATIHFDDGSIWTATTVGSYYNFDVSKATVDALTWKSNGAYLAASDGVHTTVWAKGQAGVD